MDRCPSLSRAGRPTALDFPSDEAFVDSLMTGYFAPIDPKDLLCMAWKWQRGDDSRVEAGPIPGAALKVLNSIDRRLALFGVDAQFLAQVDGELKELLGTAA